MKILMVIDSLRDGGKERRASELLKALSTYADVDCKIVLLKDNIHYQEVLTLGFEVIVFKRAYKRDITVFKKLYNVVKNYQPDVIHSWGSMPSIYCLPSVLLRRKPFVNAMISNSVCPPLSKNGIRARLTFPFSDVILANSNIGIKAYNVPEAKAKVIRNGISMNRFANLPDKTCILKEWNWQDRSNHFFIGMVASIDYRKDFPLLIEAANQFLQNNKNTTFLVIGDGPDRENIESLVLPEYRNNIVFTGKISQVESLINMLDVGVLCTHGEGTSNAIMEYMACAKPIVATNVDGNAELLEDGNLGMLVDAGNIEQLVKCWQYLKDNAHEARQYGERAYQHVSQHMNSKDVARQYLELYNQLTE